VLCLVFVSFAYLQYNDPDPIFWIGVYGTFAVMSFLRVINRQNRKLIVVAIIATGIALLFYLPGFIEWLTVPRKEEIFGEMVYEKSYIEETREFFGLLLGAASLLFQYRNA
jgi:hypothetical protein